MPRYCSSQCSVAIFLKKEKEKNMPSVSLVRDITETCILFKKASPKILKTF